MFSNKVQTRIDTIQRTIDRLEMEHEHRKQQLKLQIEREACTDCPIKPGDIVAWSNSAGNREYLGQVVSLRPDVYRGSYSFRVKILTRTGRAIGFAHVPEEKIPTLVSASKFRQIKAEAIAQEKIRKAKKRKKVSK